jgi:NAD(P)-dependent dehydrogenase (short-subunit alcohol dehydrogenase family)
MNGKHFVIIGGSHGIGLGIVKRLLRVGAQVTVVSRTMGSSPDFPDADQASGLTHVQADVVRDEIEATRLPAVIDGFAYCPGSINLGPFRQMKPEAFVEDFQLNVVGAVKCLQACLPAMKSAPSCSVVLFSTVAVSQGMPMHASVAAAKGAIEGLSRSLAAELAPSIRVNCIAPALTATPLAARFLSTEPKRAAMAEKYPLRRYGEVDDIAAMAEFLLIGESSWITGQVLAVDGGMSSIRA